MLKGVCPLVPTTQIHVAIHVPFNAQIPTVTQQRSTKVIVEVMMDKIAHQYHHHQIQKAKLFHKNHLMEDGLYLIHKGLHSHYHGIHILLHQ